jgi:hypothetical protein
MFQELVLKVGKRKEDKFKSSFCKNGYSEETTDEIWKWYTCPTLPSKK